MDWTLSVSCVPAVYVREKHHTSGLATGAHGRMVTVTCEMISVHPPAVCGDAFQSVQFGWEMCVPK